MLSIRAPFLLPTFPWTFSLCLRHLASNFLCHSEKGDCVVTLETEFMVKSYGGFNSEESYHHLLIWLPRGILISLEPQNQMTMQ